MINQMAALKCRCSASVCVSMHSCRRFKKKKTLWRRHEKETNPPLHRLYLCINRQLSRLCVRYVWALIRRTWACGFPFFRLFCSVCPPSSFILSIIISVCPSMRDSDHHMQCSTAWTVAYSIVNIKFTNSEAPQVGSIVAAWQSKSDVWPGPDCSAKASKGPKIRWNIFVTLHESHISSLAALGRALSYMTQVIIYNLREKVKLQIISSAECLLTSCIISVWTLGPLVIKSSYWQAHRDKQERKERNADRESSHQWTFSFKRELADSITGTPFKKKNNNQKPEREANMKFKHVFSL